MSFELRESIKISEDEKRIRQSVFIDEQKFTAEFDETDDRARHYVMYEGEKAIGCCRAYCDEDDPKHWHIGRIAVIPEMRGRGIGFMIVSETEEYIKKCGAEKVSLSAQLRVKGFYETLGYKTEGDVYYDEYCEHIRMVKML